MALSQRVNEASYREPFELCPQAPFDFHQSLRFLAQARAMASEHEVQGEVLIKALRVDGVTVLVRLQSRGTVTAPRLEGALYTAQTLTPAFRDAALARLRAFLSLDEDLAPFYALAAPDDAFRPVLTRFFGYHQVSFPTPFEGVCWALITQRTPNAFAYKTRQRLVDTLGSVLKVEGERYGAFPDAAQLLEADPKEVLAATNNLRKLERLKDAARAFCGADEDFLRHGPHDEVARWLKAIKGVGDWSVDFVMMRALGRMARVPWTDTGLIEAVSSVYAGGLPLHRQQVKQLASFYGDWQGYWVHYLKRAAWG